MLDSCSPPTRRDCIFGTWEGWSKCSATCGGGQTRRERSVARPSVGGGTPCQGDLLQMVQCGVEPCKDTHMFDNNIDNYYYIYIHTYIHVYI